MTWGSHEVRGDGCRPPVFRAGSLRDSQQCAGRGDSSREEEILCGSSAGVDLHGNKEVQVIDQKSQFEIEFERAVEDAVHNKHLGTRVAFFMVVASIAYLVLRIIWTT